MDVADWLRALGLQRYEAAFRANDVNVEVLPTLTADDLKELGITSIGHRRRILGAIAKLLQDDSTSLPAAKPSDDRSASIPAEDAVSQGGERRQLTVMF